MSAISIGCVIDNLKSFIPIFDSLADKGNINYRSNDEILVEEILYELIEAIELTSHLQSAFKVYYQQHYRDTEIEGDAFLQIDTKLDTVLQLLSDLMAHYQNKHDWNCLKEQTHLPGENKVLTKKDGVGRPKFIVCESQVNGLRSLGMAWKKISDLLGISSDTLRRRRTDFTSSFSYSQISDNELDQAIKSIIEFSPCSGERLIRGSLLSKSIIVQRSRLRCSIKRCRPISLTFKNRKIFRRSYSVPCPNALWHLDGNHKLIRWRMVIHGAIDGFSRLVVFLKCSSNNKGDTVLDNFIDATQTFRTPLRIRTDHGTENLHVARFMLQKHGISHHPVITGKSVHNQRIERLWVDVFIYVSQQFYNIFTSLEEEHDINPNNDLHLYVLHFIYLPRVNQALREFTRSWNHHPLRTETNQSPLSIWTAGFYEFSNSHSNVNLLSMTDNDLEMFGVDFDGPTPELQTNNDVQVPPLELQLSDESLQYLETIDPLENDGNYGIDIFCRVLSYMELH